MKKPAHIDMGAGFDGGPNEDKGTTTVAPGQGLSEGAPLPYRFAVESCINLCHINAENEAHKGHVHLMTDYLAEGRKLSAYLERSRL